MTAIGPVSEDVRRALAEDVGTGDLTAALIPADRAGEATVISRETAVICGRDWFDAVYHQLDPEVTIRWHVNDGDAIESGTLLCELQGPARSLVTGERTALNFLQLLSGTATTARSYARAVEGTGTRILDTRKTIPGLRQAQKYAIACGGCTNHRHGLYDAILIKENHIIAAGSIQQAVQESRRLHPDVTIAVEVESLAELDEALSAEADIVLRDNFSLDDLALARERTGDRARLEASGNVETQGLQAIAATGVDFISVGAMTKHVRAVDLSMRFRKA